MPTIPPTFPPRQANEDQIAFVRKLFNFNDAGFQPTGSVGVQFASVPLNSFIMDVKAEVVTTFNATTTNPITFGTTATTCNELMSSTDITSSVAGTYSATRGFGSSLTQTATPAISNVSTAEGGIGLFAKYVPTGGAATQGAVRFVLTYAPPGGGGVSGF